MADAAGVAFDEAAFNAGILTAMQLGLPPNPAERPIFVFADQVTNSAPADEDHVPFDPWANSTVVPGSQMTGVVCAIDYLDAAGQVVDLGIVTPSRIKVTLLDAQYRAVRGFSHVLIAGDRYVYHHTEPPIGLASAGVWIIDCTAEDDT